MTILILGGTAEARALAGTLVADGRQVISSLAGRVTSPALPTGQVRIGGFGGPDGLVSFIREQGISAVVDATHPFAARMSQNAAEAARATDRPLLRLTRPSWRDHPEASLWTWVSDVAEAVATTHTERPFVTTGRQSLAAFLPWADRAVLVRVVEPPSFELPSRWELIRSRGPYDRAGERLVIVEHDTDVLVTKDSGGSLTSAKLEVATDLGVRVVVISRPAGPVGVETRSTVGEAEAWLGALTSAGE